MTNKTSFWQHINNGETKSIIIPILQRDYAQGRDDKASLRIAFLKSIKAALDKDKPQLVLDFVYGSENNGKFFPLDGQQRLTTLWLLHWYLTLLVNKGTEQLKEDFNVLKKFTYETRLSSREFIAELCNPDNFKNFDNENLRDYIINQTWYYSFYNQDQTIAGILNMLSRKCENDNIEKILGSDSKKLNDYYVKLFNSDNSNECPILYNKLKLEKFDLSDDLYIKMNARGKQLTKFENFKAEVAGLIRDMHKANPNNECWKKLNDERNGFAIKIDTGWINIFWSNVGNSEELKDFNDIGKEVDGSFFKFILGLYFTKLIQNTELSKNINTEVYRYLSDQPEMKELYITSYLDFLKYDDLEIDDNFLDYLLKVLDNLSKSYPSKISNNDFIDYDSPFKLILNSKNDSYNLIGKILLTGFAKYFYQGEYEPRSFIQWKRFLFNITLITDNEGETSLRDIRLVKTALDLINNEKIDSHNLYDTLKIFDSSFLSQSGLKSQLEEEIEKAKKRAEEGWDKKIEEAERYAFFNGSIRFLFQDKEGKWDWSKFDEKFKRAKDIFDNNGLKGDVNQKTKMVKDFVTSCDKWMQLYDNSFIFNPNRGAWRWILTCGYYAKQVDMILTDTIEIATNYDDNSDFNYLLDQIKNLPFKWIIETIPDIRIFWKHYRLAIFKKGAWEAIFFDFNGLKRNEILSYCVENNFVEILAENRIGCDNYFWGCNIHFNIKTNPKVLLCFSHDGNVYIDNSRDKPLLNTIEFCNKDKDYKIHFVKKLEEELKSCLNNNT